MLTLRFGHSHVYPGALARTDATLPADGETPCLVAFADGVQVPARLAGGNGALRLRVEAYRTARGTSIPVKHCCLAAYPGAGGGTALRVTSRVTFRTADPT